MHLISGSGNHPLAAMVAVALGTQLTPARVTRFADGEIDVELMQSVRGDDVYVIQSVAAPVNDHLMELLLLLDALKRAGPRSVRLVIPYLGYARQDRKERARTPIGARMVADLIQAAAPLNAFNGILTLDLHAPQLQGFFNVPVDNLYAAPLMERDITTKYANNKPIIVSPDVGGVRRARYLAERLSTDLAIIDKRRSGPGQSEALHVIGDVKGHPCILIDDMIDSGKTLVTAAGLLLEHGATSVAAYATHGVLSGDAIATLKNSKLTEVVITDTIAHDIDALAAARIRPLSVAQLLGNAIDRLQNGQSLAALF